MVRRKRGRGKPNLEKWDKLTSESHTGLISIIWHSLLTVESHTSKSDGYKLHVKC